MKPSPFGLPQLDSDLLSSDAPLEDAEQLRREVERYRRRLKQLDLEIEGLRDWAESVEGELSALKKTFWYRLLVWKR